MDGRQKPDPQPESDNDLNDEEIIDLTLIVDGEDDDDIIDLSDILEQPGQALDDADEAVIPLVDAIPSEQMTDLSEDTDNEILDLTDVAPSLQPDEAVSNASVENEELADEEALIEEDGVIDLMDVATTLEADIAEPETPPAQPVEEAPEEDGIIDLMDVASIDTPKEDAIASPSDDEEKDIIDLMDAEEPETTSAEDSEFAELKSRAEAMLVDTMGSETESEVKPLDFDTPEEADQPAGPDKAFMVLENDEQIIDDYETPTVIDDQPEGITDIPEPISDSIPKIHADLPEDTEAAAGQATIDEPEPVAEPITETPFVPAASPSPPAAEPVPLTEAQVELALERVIEKIYAEKIEQLMIQAIEKTVNREIEKIKNALMEDNDGMVG